MKNALFFFVVLSCIGTSCALETGKNNDTQAPEKVELFCPDCQKRQQQQENSKEEIKALMAVRRKTNAGK